MRSWSRPDVHATWHEGAICLWSWDGRPGRQAPVQALYGEVYGGRAMGRVDEVRVTIPDLGLVGVPCVRWPVRAAADSLHGRPCSPTWSASLAWFHEVVTLAGKVVGSRRVVPSLTAGAPRWTIVRDGELDERLASLTAGMPPVVAAAGPVDLGDVVSAFADAVARSGLRAVWWKPAGDGRQKPALRLVKSVMRELADDPNAPFRFDIDPALLRQLERAWTTERSTLLHEPVVRPRLRMVPPGDPEAPWDFGLEVVDVRDRARWCTAADVSEQTPLALEVAGEPRHVAVLARIVAEAARGLTQRFAAMRPLAGEPAAGVGLDVEQVSELLERAGELDEVGVELLGPEELVRAAVRVNAKATPVPPGGRSAGLDAAALVSWSAQVDDVPVDPDALARAEMSGSALMQVGGRWVRLDRTQVRRVLQTISRNQAELTVVDPATLLRLAADAAETVFEGVGWTGDLLAGLPDDRLVETTESGGFRGELRHYQRRGLSWLGFLARLGLGGCLADDMGLGKTATTLAHLLERPGPHLVVCPLSVVRNWQQEAARFTPGLHVVVHHGGERVQGEGAAEELSGADLVVTTYGLLTREIGTLAEVRWGTVVLDEAQAVKNPNTKAARAVRKLVAGQRIALTGTPIENRLSELWAILDALNHGLLGSLAKFQSVYANPIERQHDADVAEQLRRLTQPFLLRRTKADKSLVPDLPDKVEQIAWAPLTKEQAAMYQGVVDQLLEDAAKETGMRRRGLVLASLTRLKQICNHPAQALGDQSRLGGRSGKLARFDELVDELLDAEEQALVFTQYRTMGELLQRHLAERLGRPVPFLHGGVARPQRDSMVKRFQAGTGGPLLLVSLKAGGTGLNLTAASRVIHYDRWWNPAVEDQATDRAWRIGQERTVFVHKLVCSGTLEERIGQLIDDKRALASAVVGTTGEAWLSELSTDELRALVVLDREEDRP